MMFICLNYLRTCNLCTCHLQGIELILPGEDVHQHDFPKKIKTKFRSLQQLVIAFKVLLYIIHL
ncbi:hypothetical protein Hanom_Chr02g00152411 [Helianthus anomalus]